MTAVEKSKRGFASMTPERRQEVARKGGLAVKPENRAFSKDKKLAVKAGRKGGSSVSPQNRAFSRNPALASSAGRKGGLAGPNPATSETPES
ncbi:MAG: stress-induced protein [Rhizobiales bacterium 62-17]|nr:MAG: stress-induced protein [Rhizobiales bacterium 62-17]